MDEFWRKLVFSSEAEYLEFCSSYAALPVGFSAATCRLDFAPEERPDRRLLMDLSFVRFDGAAYSWTALFTRNAVCGVPVAIGKERLGNPLEGFVINNRIANVGTAEGRKRALAVLDAFSSVSGVPSARLLPVSTGIIGWELPYTAMSDRASWLVSQLGSIDGLALARAIMTTDSYPKLISLPLGEGKLWAMAKGAGMIEPNLATMLVFIFTDVKIEQSDMDEVLIEAVDMSFNRISVDGDQSTSDSVFCVSTGVFPAVSRDEFAEALNTVCAYLAEQIVRNGEGTSHVVRMSVSGWDDKTCVDIGRAIINSELVKTAIYGNDPNVGRIAAACGAYCGKNAIECDPSKMRIYLGTELVYDKGKFLLDKEKEALLSSLLRDCYMPPDKTWPPHFKYMDIRLEYPGRGKAILWGSDLSHQYVHINADYRS
ncbi:bifunctional ornithine acetyltransferase/N-acetylglutamate synthase [Spirochaetia bacterium 38H-sp]|uniref:Arginine biosynthesis bifunctional protein ArgJ n=1 Tax=Rarispira pelagica TaxID=3141764 RepID=A0ABU9UCH8_9SPIR